MNDLDALQTLTVPDLPDLSDLPVEEITWNSVVKDPRLSGLEGMEDAILQTYRRKISAVVSRLAEIGLPKPGEQFRLITRRSFNAIEMLEYILRREPVTELRMAIYSINYYAAQILVEHLASRRIGSAEIMMSNLRNAAYRVKEEIVKNQLLRLPNVTLWFCSSHAKIMACRTASGQHYIIEGSGNHAYNSRLEQYVIDNDPEIYQFTGRWMEDIKSFLRDKKELVLFGTETDPTESQPLKGENRK